MRNNLAGKAVRLDMDRNLDMDLAGISGVAIGTLVISLVTAMALHFIVFLIADRMARRTKGETDDLLIAAIRGPTRWLLLLLTLGAGMESLHLSARLSALWSIASAMSLAALLGWLAIRLLRVGKRVVEINADISVADNLRARRRQTRVRILYRIAQCIVGFVAIAFMLMSIPSVRSVGVTLLASAGLVGLAVGAAAQPALKNLIAGIQMAFTEPIRLDDVVIVEGEWGRIEDIRLTYVVVRIWDDRRMVVPVSYFLEKPFQNWTRETSHLLGTIFFHVDPTADVPRIRSRLEQAAQDHPLWDRRVAILQVTEVRPEAMELRALVSASDAGRAFDLRCDVREAIMAYLRDDMPSALPKERTSIMRDRGGVIVPDGSASAPASAHS